MTAASTADGLNIYNRVEDLPPVWDAVANLDGISFGRNFLRAVQQRAVDSSGNRYLVYQAPTGAAVIAVGRVLRQPCSDNPVADVLLGRLSDRTARGRNWLLPMLLLRAELNGDQPFVAGALAGPERRKILLQMLSALEGHAKREGWLLAVAGVPADDVALIDGLRRSGYLRTEGRPIAEVYLRWDSWEEFLKYARSRSKNAAASIRNEVNRAHREGLRFVEWDPEIIPETMLHRLQDEHERRQSGRGFGFQAGFLSTLMQAMSNSVRVLLALSATGQVQGVTVLACNGRRGYVLFAGLVEKAERTGSAYFNLAYYQPMRLAIELGLESLSYGYGALPAKIRRGSTVTATGLFIRPKFGLTRAVMGVPMALHRRMLQHKYAPLLQAPLFSNLR